MPTVIGLTGGTLTVEHHQGLVDEHYAVVEITGDTGSTTVENLTGSDFTSKASSFTNEDSNITPQVGGVGGREPFRPRDRPPAGG